MKRVVIIGGGFTGALCARELENDFQVTLIDNKDHFEFTPGVLRTLVEPEHRFNIQALHQDYLKKARVLIDQVVSLSHKEVRTKKRKVPFDYLIIASGSSYNPPIKAGNVIQATRAEILHKYHREVDAANSIGIVGAGIVGVELASEIASHYPGKTLGIIGASSEVMKRSNIESRDYARRFLERRGVDLHLGERIEKMNGETCVTRSGKQLKFDLVFVCTGITPNSSFMKGKFASKLDTRGFIKVNEFLQLQDSRNIFVGGDVASISEEKLAQTSEKHARVIVQNIRRLERKKKLKNYTSKKRLMVISLGKRDGIIEFGNMVITGLVAGLGKRIVERKAMRKYR